MQGYSEKLRDSLRRPEIEQQFGNVVEAVDVALKSIPINQGGWNNEQTEAINALAQAMLPLIQATKVLNTTQERRAQQTPFLPQNEPTMQERLPGIDRSLEQSLTLPVIMNLREGDVFPPNSIVSLSYLYILTGTKLEGVARLEMPPTFRSYIPNSLTTNDFITNEWPTVDNYLDTYIENTLTTAHRQEKSKNESVIIEGKKLEAQWFMYSLLSNRINQLEDLQPQTRSELDTLVADLPQRLSPIAIRGAINGFRHDTTPEIQALVSSYDDLVKALRPDSTSRLEIAHRIQEFTLSLGNAVLPEKTNLYALYDTLMKRHADTIFERLSGLESDLRLTNELIVATIDSNKANYEIVSHLFDSLQPLKEFPQNIMQSARAIAANQALTVTTDLKEYYASIKNFLRAMQNAREKITKIDTALASGFENVSIETLIQWNQNEIEAWKQRIQEHLLERIPQETKTSEQEAVEAIIAILGKDGPAIEQAARIVQAAFQASSSI